MLLILEFYFNFFYNVWINTFACVNDPSILCNMDYIICLEWDLNPRVFTTAGLKSAPLDHSGIQARWYSHHFIIIRLIYFLLCDDLLFFQVELTLASLVKPFDIIYISLSHTYSNILFWIFDYCSSCMYTLFGALLLLLLLFCGILINNSAVSGSKNVLCICIDVNLLYGYNDHIWS